MSKVFEDEYMEIQSDLISLCLEVTEEKIDKVYAYVSIEKESRAFNAFFEVNGQINNLTQLGIDFQLGMQFLKIGTEDVEKIPELCNKYNMPVPTEIKMYYDTKSGHYNAEYRYEEICSEKTGICSGDIFDEWFEEKRNELK